MTNLWLTFGITESNWTKLGLDSLKKHRYLEFMTSLLDICRDLVSTYLLLFDLMEELLISLFPFNN